MTVMPKRRESYKGLRTRLGSATPASGQVPPPPTAAPAAATPPAGGVAGSSESAAARVLGKAKQATGAVLGKAKQAAGAVRTATGSLPGKAAALVEGFNVADAALDPRIDPATKALRAAEGYLKYETAALGGMAGLAVGGPLGALAGGAAGYFAPEAVEALVKKYGSRPLAKYDPWAIEGAEKMPVMAELPSTAIERTRAADRAAQAAAVPAAVPAAEPIVGGVEYDRGPDWGAVRQAVDAETLRRHTTPGAPMPERGTGVIRISGSDQPPTVLGGDRIVEGLRNSATAQAQPALPNPNSRTYLSDIIANKQKRLERKLQATEAEVEINAAKALEEQSKNAWTRNKDVMTMQAQARKDWLTNLDMPEFYEGLEGMDEGKAKQVHAQRKADFVKFVDATDPMTGEPVKKGDPSGSEQLNWLRMTNPQAAAAADQRLMTTYKVNQTANKVAGAFGRKLRPGETPPVRVKDELEFSDMAKGATLTDVLLAKTVGTLGLRPEGGIVFGEGDAEQVRSVPSIAGGFFQPADQEVLDYLAARGIKVQP